MGNLSAAAAHNRYSMNRPTFDTSVDDFCTVTFTDRDVTDAVRLLGRIKTAELIGPAAPMANAKEPALISPQVHKEELLGRARRALSDRRRRRKMFGSAMFGEPAWEMLLILYIEQDFRRLNISRLTKFADLALSTALRWLDYLEQHQHIQRVPHPTDHRAFFVELTDKGRETLNSYFSEKPNKEQ